VRCSDLAGGVSQPAGILPCSGTFSDYTHGTLTVQIPFSGSYAIPVNYQIRVQNTGSVPLTLSLSDPLCDPGTISAPIGVSGLSGRTLAPGGAAYFTCSHRLTQNDPDTTVAGQPFKNTATVFGTPPSGPSIHRTSIVTVHRQRATQPFHFCRNFKTGKRIRYHGNTKPAACRPGKPNKPSGFTG